MVGAQVHCTPSTSIGASRARTQTHSRQGVKERKGRISSAFGGAINKLRRNAVAIKPLAASNDASPDQDDLLRLREENAALRAQLADRLETMEAAQRDALLAEHRSIIKAANELGENITPLDGSSIVEEAAVEVVAEPEVVVVAAAEEEEEEQKQQVPQDVVASIFADIPVVVEVDRDDALVFKFGESANSSKPAPVSVSNRSSATAMAKNVNSASGGAGAGGDASEGTIVFRFDEDTKDAKTTSTPVAEMTTTPSTPAVVAAASTTTEASSGSDESSSEEETSATASSSSSSSKTTKRGRKSTSGTATKPKTTRKRSTSTTSKSKKDPYAAARAAATTEAQSHDASAVLAGKEDWLYATVPATPVSGAQCTLYFNRAQSAMLRGRPHLEVMVGFNDWELRPSEAADRAEFTRADGVAQTDTADFWKVTVDIPADSYEVQFVVGDGEGSFDNNEGKNYHLAVDGPMTRESWIDAAPERAEAAYLERKEAERVAAEKEAKEREEQALAADTQRAEEIVGELKSRHNDWLAGAAANGVLPLWRVAAPAVSGGKARLLYNRSAGCLGWLEVPADQEEHAMALKIGHNGWKSPQDVPLKRATGIKDDGDWWEASIDVPKSAVVLDFAVQCYEHFDNNNGADHRLAVALPRGVTSVEAWANGLLKEINAEITETRRAAEAAEVARQEAQRQEREAARAKAREVRRRQMRHVLYTEPSAPVAGKELTIHYNPDNTGLQGAERVFVRGSYNHWRHPKTYGPLELTPPSSSSETSHHSITLQVPKDAYSLDFVFSDAEEGGRFDNRGGLDYHLPVEKSVVSETPMYVMHVAVEMAPICKVGGLGDVVTALGRAVQDQGHLVEVILPRYDFFLSSPLLGATKYETEFDWAGTRIFVSTCIVEGLRCWFIEPANGMFSGDVVYRGGAQDPGRFAFFSRAALEFLMRTQRQPDILHCHDWSSAEVARAYWTEYHAFGLYKPKVVFTIHNLGYGVQAIGEAAHHCQRFTTVSPTYAWEIGGEAVIAPHVNKLMGIRNGIDGEIWNPETDQFLPRGYNASTCIEGKAAAREELRRRLGLTGWNDKPLVAVVSRLTKQKGTHLIAHAAHRTMERGGQFILLGSAPDPKVQAEFDDLAGQMMGDNAAFCFAFDEPLSHLIYAAADIVLVPSMFEPCGLTQMIAMRYGAVPVVRHTGGLRDTVFDVDHDQGRAAWELEGSTDWQGEGVEATNGFAFEGTDPGALDYALNRAFDAFYNDNQWFRNLQCRVMTQDWSWNKPGEEYVELYYAALKQ